MAAKIYNGMILNRIRMQVYAILRKHRNGFRPGRSTVSQIFLPRRFTEGIKMKNLSAMTRFVDFKKAFDSIHRKMFLILKAYGIPDRIVKVVEIMYNDTEAQVITLDGETGFFHIYSTELSKVAHSHSLYLSSSSTLS